MIIDAHHHLWQADLYGWLDDSAMAPIRRDYATDDLRGELVTSGVDATILVEAAHLSYEESARFLAIAASTPEILGVVAWTDFTAPRLLDHPSLVGVRDQVQLWDGPAFPAEVMAGLREIAASGLAIDLILRPDQLAEAGLAVAAVPEVRFVLDHLGKPPIASGDLGQWRDDLARLAERPNVVGKLSGLATEADWANWTPDDLAPVVAHALAVFGPDRLMWGSDWPVCELATTYSRWLEVARSLVPPAAHDAVFASTARHVYGI